MKIDWIKTLIGFIIIVLCAAMIHFVPVLMFIITPFILINLVPIYYHSKNSYYAVGIISILITTFIFSPLVMAWMMGVLLGGYIVGQLLLDKSSKERILYILTVFYSLYVLLTIVVFQLVKLLPSVDIWFKDFYNIYFKLLQTEVDKGTVGEFQLDLLKQSFDMLYLQMPGIIIMFLFVLAILQVIVTLPLIRKFKVATPNFRPLYMWQIPKIVFYLLVIATVIQLMVTKEEVVIYGIVINLQYVLKWIIFIQGLSVFHFFMKAKRTKSYMNAMVFILAFLLPTVTQLFGIIDMIVNLKRIIAKR